MLRNRETILIVGGESVLAGPLRELFLKDGFEVFLTSRQVAKRRISGFFYLDLLDTTRRDLLPSVDFALILAGITGEDACQAKPELSRAVNVEGTVRIAQELVSRGTFVVFLSTSRVFAGTTPNPSPHDPISPRGFYGKLKAEAEALLLRLENLAVLRLTKVAGSSTRLAETISAKFSKGEITSFSSTTITSPLSYDEVYAAIFRIMSGKASGLFQLGGQENMTEVEFAQTWLRDFPEILEKISTHDGAISENALVHESLATYLPPVEKNKSR